MPATPLGLFRWRFLLTATILLGAVTGGRAEEPRESDAALFTDLPSRVVGGFVPARGVGEGWIPITWETAEHKGTGLAAGGGSGAATLTLDLGLKGWHTLHFALGSSTALRVWLDGETGDRDFVTQHGTYALQECRYHAADLTGRRVHVALSAASKSPGAFLGYIRAERSAGQRRRSRNLIATNDGVSPFWSGGLDSIDDLGRYFSPFRDSDFFRILFGPVGADVTACHATRVGTLLPQSPTDAFHAEQREESARMARVAHEPGFDILRAAVANAHDVGLEIHFYIRMEAFRGPFPLDPRYTSRFYDEHPEWRCRDEFGDEIARMSYAFPGVQDHMLEYFAELLAYRPDGLCLSFNRGLPMMIAEEPVLAEFERRQGRRPRLPEEVDGEGMIEARTALMTGFLDRVKAQLDARDMALSCIVHPDEVFNRTCGLDLESLAARGVFESICVHSGGYHAPRSAVHNSPFWRKLRDSKRVAIYPAGSDGSSGHADIARFLRDDIFGQGFAGGFFWDAENYFTNPYRWHVIRQGGTPEFLEGVAAGKIPSPKITPLTRLQGMKLGRYSPGASY